MTTSIDKLKRLLRRSKQGSALTAVAVAALAAEAGAQDQEDDRALSGIDGVETYELRDDGSLLLRLETGEVLTLPAGEFSLVGGEVILTEGGFDLVLLALAEGADAALAYWAALAAVGGVGVAALADGDSGSSSEEPDPVDPVDPGDTTPPVITSAATASVAENTAVETVVYQTIATDETATSLTYSLSGADADLFAIDADTGAVTFIASPDHETPGSAADSNEYSFTVTVSDGSNETSQDIVLTVTDLDEAAPVFTSNDEVFVEENVSTDTVVYAAMADDQDNDGTGLSFSLSGADADLFAIDADTGEVTFVASPDFEAPGSAADSNAYSITVTVSDGTNQTSQDVVIHVTDVEDTGSDNEPPEFTSAVSVEVAENTATTDVVYTAIATDPDGDDAALTYAVSGVDADKFAIDADTGEVTFVASPDHETPRDEGGDNNYNLTITASDGTDDGQPGYHHHGH